MAGSVGRQPVAAAPRRHGGTDVPEAAGSALHIPRVPGFKAAALDGVPGVVAEDADAVAEHGKVCLVCFVPVQLACAALPWLAVQQDVPPAGQIVQSGTEGVHGLHVVKTHKVEPEAVYVVLLRPVKHRVDEVPPCHEPLAGKLVAAAAAVGKAAIRVLTEKVIGHRVVQYVFGAVHVVIHHVHYHPDACGVEGGDHGFALPDAHLAPVGVGGVAALRDVVVGGVVAPVILPQQGAALVHAAKVEDRHQLHIAHPQIFQVVQTGGVDALPPEGGALLGKGKELAPPRRAHPAGGVLRKVPDADLPHRAAAGGDHRAGVPLPAGRGGAGQVHDHAAGAVDTGGAGVGVAGLPGDPVHGDVKGVVASVLVAGEPDAPHALPVALQRQGTYGAAAVVPAVQPHRYRLRCRRPQPQPGAGKGVVCPQRSVPEGIACKALALVQRLQLCGGFCTHGFFIPSCEFPMYLV